MTMLEKEAREMGRKSTRITFSVPSLGLGLVPLAAVCAGVRVLLIVMRSRKGLLVSYKFVCHRFVILVERMMSMIFCGKERKYPSSKYAG